jgi:outer membrane receptor protein involved in Fe transport
MKFQKASVPFFVPVAPRVFTRALLCALCASVVNAASPSDEIITLDEFSVSASSLKDDYIVTESTSGTRLAEKIVNLPYNVEVITDRMIEDFMLFDQNDLLSFVGSAAPVPDSGNPDDGFAGKIRGFTTLVLRNGFRDRMPVAPSNMQQVDIIKGPLSTLYGQSQPGGFINEVSKRPMTSTHASLTSHLGTDADFRLSGAATGPVPGIPKLFYRAFVDYFSRNGRIGYVDFEESWRLFSGISFLYQFQKNTSLTATLQYQPLWNTNTGTTLNTRDARYWIEHPNLDTKLRYGGINEIMGTTNLWYADNNERTVNFSGLNLLFEHRISPVFSTRAVLQGSYRDADSTRWDAGTTLYLYDPYYDPALAASNPELTRSYTGLAVYNSTQLNSLQSITLPNGTAGQTGLFNSYTYNGNWNARTPVIQDNSEKRLAAQIELTAQVRRNHATHKLFLALDASTVKTDEKTLSYTTDTGALDLDLATTGAVLHRNEDGSITNGNASKRANGINNYHNSHIPTDLRAYKLNINTSYTQNTAGALASYRLSTLRDHLAFTASARFDCFDHKIVNHKEKNYNPSTPFITPEPRSMKTTGSKPTGSLGLNYQLLGSILLAYASVSTGYIISETVDRGLLKLIPSRETLGYEAGFKGASDDNQFGYTLSFYKITLENHSFPNENYYDSRDAGRQVVPQYLSVGTLHATGIDLGFNYRPPFLNGLVFITSLGYVDQKNKNVPAGTPDFQPNKPSTTVAKFTGSLIGRYRVPKGVLRGLSCGFGATYRGSMTGYYETDYSYALECPAVFLLRGFIAYEFKTGRYEHFLRLNAANLLDKTYYTRAGRQYYGRTVSASYTVRF